MTPTRLPKWRYTLRRFLVFAGLAILLYTTVSLITETLGVHICAEDICYAPYVEE